MEVDKSKSRQRIKLNLAVIFVLTILNALIAQSNANFVVNFSQEDLDSYSEIDSPSSHSRQKRDTDNDDVTNTESENNDQVCKTQKSNFEELRKKLKNNERLETTHTFLNESKFNLALAWAAKNDKGNLLVLTSERKLFMDAKSTLWRSKDNGRTWDNWNSKVDNKTFRQADGLQRNPHNPEKVYLISYEHYMYNSEDSGETWKKYDVETDEQKQKVITLDEQLEFHTEFENYILIISNERKLYVSYDNFNSPLGDHIQQDVNVVKWGTKEQKGEHSMSIFATIGKRISPFFKKGPMVNELKRYNHKTKDWSVILRRVATFDIQEKFMYASIYKNDHPTSEEDERIMMISSDGGDTWDEAQLPTLNGDRFFSVLDMSEGLIFMHVDNPGDTGHGVLFTSSENGIVYSESLKNHLYPNYNTVHDFYKIKSIRGVFLASQMSDDKSIHSVVTYNLGGEWKKVKRPIEVECENDDSKGCNLQIHNAYSIHRGIKAKMPHSLEDAKGLVLIHGHVAANLQTSPPDVYLSTDGGYNFRRVLRGPHAYEIGDSGGLIVAVPISDDYPKVVKFSTDEGNCWHTYQFTTADIKFTGLLTEPGGRSMTLSIWGYTRDTKKWTINVIDFSEVVTRQCGVNDYEDWIPHSGVGNNNDGCILGLKETFKKIKRDSWCRNGYENADFMEHSSSECDCTQDDYECDFGFYRDLGSTKCIRQPDVTTDQLEICKDGAVEKIITIGYRKIPGNKCKEGAFNPPRTEVNLKDVCKAGDKQPIIDDLKPVPKNTGGSKTIITAILILVVMVILAVGVFFGYKYILLRRHKVVYRYSMLNQTEGRDDEVENALIGNDSLFNEDSDEELQGVEQENKSPQKQQTGSQRPQLRGYHDDSDDDLLA